MQHKTCGIFLALLQSYCNTWNNLKKFNTFYNFIYFFSLSNVWSIYFRWGYRITDMSEANFLWELIDQSCFTGARRPIQKKTFLRFHMFCLNKIIIIEVKVLKFLKNVFTLEIFANFFKTKSNRYFWKKRDLKVAIAVVVNKSLDIMK